MQMLMVFCPHEKLLKRGFRCKRQWKFPCSLARHWLELALTSSRPSIVSSVSPYGNLQLPLVFLQHCCILGALSWTDLLEDSWSAIKWAARRHLHKVLQKVALLACWPWLWSTGGSNSTNSITFHEFVIFSFVDNISMLSKEVQQVVWAFFTLQAFLTMWGLTLDLSKTYAWGTTISVRRQLAQLGLQVVEDFSELGGTLSFTASHRVRIFLKKGETLHEKWQQLRRSRAPLSMKLSALPIVFWARALHGTLSCVQAEHHVQRLRTLAVKHTGCQLAGSNPFVAPFPFAADDGRSWILSIEDRHFWFSETLPQEPWFTHILANFHAKIRWIIEGWPFFQTSYLAEWNWLADPWTTAFSRPRWIYLWPFPATSKNFGISSSRCLVPVCCEPCQPQDHDWLAWNWCCLDKIGSWCSGRGWFGTCQSPSDRSFHFQTGNTPDTTPQNNLYANDVCSLILRNIGWSVLALQNTAVLEMTFQTGLMMHHLALHYIFLLPDHHMCCNWSVTSLTCLIPAAAFTASQGKGLETMFSRTVRFSVGLFLT